MNTIPRDNTCFGRLWEANSVECRGGYDPAFVGNDGKNIRPMCDLFQACGAQKAAANMSRFQVPLQPPAVPVGVRPTMSPPSSVSARPSFLSNYSPPTPQTAYQQGTYRGMSPGHDLVHVKPVELVPSNWYTVPSILAELEPMDQFNLRNAAMTAGRGAAVGALMALAHFVSNAPFKRGG